MKRLKIVPQPDGERKNAVNEDEEIEYEDCVYWNDDLEECELEKELDDNGECDDYS